MRAPRKGCKYVWEPVHADYGIFLRGAVVTVVGCPGMPRAKVPPMFRFVEHDGEVRLVMSASLKPYRSYRDAGRVKGRRG